MNEELRVIPVTGMPEVREGMKVGELIAERIDLEQGDVVVVSQKIVSKAEGMIRQLSSVDPSDRALELASELGKEAALVELILSESREVLRAERGILITETKHGFVCANSGIDSSNLLEDDTVCLLPKDPDASARSIRPELPAVRKGYSRPLPAVVIADSFGRAWRLGQVEVAIGCAGLASMDDWRGRQDASGRGLQATVIGIADEVAAAADLVRSKDAGVPVAVVRGLGRYVTSEDGPGAVALRRPPAEDLFR
jgi:coenzyme F420-0:L-glutamate ligase/coenzyme F420-1:gamma-L-glutamate ligase